ncbi:MAG: glycosyltransferase [Longimicrobiales bacterium]
MTRDSPAVSVLMPVRDGGAHLYEAMDSLVAQTFGDFEVIVVNDGSVDGTAAELERWTSRDDRIRVLTSKPVGIVRALETARGEARGRFLARMDADDIADPRRLALQYDFLDAHPRVSGCGCGVRYFPEEHVRDGARRYEAWINGIRSPSGVNRAIWVECPIAHPTFFLRSEAVAEVGGYQDHGWPEDYDLILRMHAAGHDLANVPEILHLWREGAARLSRTDARYAPEAFLSCRVHHLLQGPLGEGRPVVVWGAGPVGKSFARALQARGTRVTAFVDLNPRKIGQEIHGAPVLEPAKGLEIRGPLHAAAVGQPGARGRIEALLEGGGMVPGVDFVAVA